MGVGKGFGNTFGVKHLLQCESGIEGVKATRAPDMTLLSFALLKHTTNAFEKTDTKTIQQ